MTNKGKIRMGDLGTDIEIFFEDTNVNDVNAPLDISASTSKQITFIAPNGTEYGPFDMSFITSGVDGGAHYITDQSTSFWTQAGRWRWFGTVTFTTGEWSTNDAEREILE